MDLSLYLILDPEFCQSHTTEQTLELAIRGGVTAVQLRSKTISDEEFSRLAQKMKSITDTRRIPLIINDRIEVAKAIGACGLHLGPADLNPRRARDILGEGITLGFSVPSLPGTEIATTLPVDYWGVGPVFPTETKGDAAPPMGLSGLRQVCEVSNRPVVAIGGIGVDNVGPVLKAGASGVAVLSAICGAQDPEAASRNLKSLIQRPMVTCMRRGE